MWVKICGIRDLETARRVTELRPDAIGLNFFAGTPRVVEAEVASEIVEAVAGSVEPVGLFVNHSLADVQRIAEKCRLGTVQIHGDESPEFLSALHESRPDLNILRAFRVGDEGLDSVADYLAECDRLDVRLAGCLIDSRVDGKYGGSGHTAPWDLLRDHYDAARWPRLILAGGLNVENVAQAIETVSPVGVDVASGVESSAGVKDLELVQQFIQAARNAT